MLTLFSRARCPRTSAVASSLTISLLLLSGCSVQQLAPVSSGPDTYALPDVSGTAIGGEIPIQGGAVTLYSSTTSTGTAKGAYTGTAQILGTATTGTNGFFTITTNGNSCAAGSVVYLTIVGGNTGGSGNNPNAVIGTMLGICGSIQSFVVVNEVTTVAMAYSMSSFLSFSGANNTVVNITAPVKNSSTASSNNVTSMTVSTASGLGHAYKNFANLVDPAAGVALATPAINATNIANSPSLSNAIAPQAEINTLANILQSCVNTSGGGGADQFSTPTAPSTTAGATASLYFNTTTSAVNGTVDISFDSAAVSGFTGLVGGSGYSPATTVSFTGGGSGSGATATPVISGGIITSITLNTGGSGYTSAPTVVISDSGGGTGASATATTYIYATGTIASTTSPATFASAFNGISAFSSAGLSAAVTGSNLNIVTISGPVSTVTNTNALSFTGTTLTGPASDGTGCGQLFQFSPFRGSPIAYPQNSFQAAYNIARNPWISAANVTSLYNLGVGVGAAFSPNLSGSAPADWTLAIAYPVPRNPVSGNGIPLEVALDADDNVYVTSPDDDVFLATSSNPITQDSSSACLFGFSSNGKFLPTITPYVGTPGTVGSGTAGTGTAGTSTWFCVYSALGAAGDTELTNMAPDALGNIWIANTGLYNATVTSNYDRIVNVAGANGNASQGAGVFTADYQVPTEVTRNYTPIAVATDTQNDVWLSVLSSASATQNLIELAAGSGGITSTGSNLAFQTGSVLNCFAACRMIAFDSLQNVTATLYGGASGGSGSVVLGGGITTLPLKTLATTSPSYTPATYNAFIKTKVSTTGNVASNSTTNQGPWGVAYDAAGTAWVTVAGATGQSISAGAVGIYYMTFSGGPPITTVSTGGNHNTPTPSITLNSPKGVEVDGNGDVFFQDTAGVFEFSSLAQPQIGYISGVTGFAPCITTGTSCTGQGPYFTYTNSLAIDSTGSVWFTTPNATYGSVTNGNLLVQMIGTASATWPLLSTGHPGSMPQ